MHPSHIATGAIAFLVGDGHSIRPLGRGCVEGHFSSRGVGGILHIRPLYRGHTVDLFLRQEIIFRLAVRGEAYTPQPRQPVHILQLCSAALRRGCCLYQRDIAFHILKGLL